MHPKLVYWDGLPFILIQGAFSAAPSERASFCKPCFSSCRLAEDSRAANTQSYCLCMAKDGGDFIASWAFCIHEIGIGALHQELLPMFPLLLFWRGMKKILCERHVLTRRSSPPERGDSQFLGGLISSPGVPQGERGLEFSRRRKGQRFFPSTSLVLVSSFHLFFFFFSLQHLLFFLEPVYN